MSTASVGCGQPSSRHSYLLQWTSVHNPLSVSGLCNTGYIHTCHTPAIPLCNKHLHLTSIQQPMRYTTLVCDTVSDKQTRSFCLALTRRQADGHGKPLKSVRIDNGGRPRNVHAIKCMQYGRCLSEAQIWRIPMPD